MDSCFCLRRYGKTWVGVSTRSGSFGGTSRHTSSARRVFRDLPTQLRNGAPVAIAPGGLQALKIRGSFGLPEVSKMSCLLRREEPTGYRDVRCSLRCAELGRRKMNWWGVREKQ